MALDFDSLAVISYASAVVILAVMQIKLENTVILNQACPARFLNRNNRQIPVFNIVGRAAGLRPVPYLVRTLDV